MHAHILIEFCYRLISGGHTVCQSYPSRSLSPAPLILPPLCLSLCCCPSLSQTFDTPMAAITIANVWSVGSHLSYRLKWDEGMEAERKLFDKLLVWQITGHMTFNVKFHNPHKLFFPPKKYFFTASNIKNSFAFEIMTKELFSGAKVTYRPATILSNENFIKAAWTNLMTRKWKTYP